MSQERNIYLRHKISREQPMAAQTMTIQISSSENASLLLSLHKLPLWRENSP